VCLIVCVITETPKGALCSKLGTTGKKVEGSLMLLPCCMSVRLCPRLITAEVTVRFFMKFSSEVMPLKVTSTP
jgi:hypothetical protein